VTAQIDDTGDVIVCHTRDISREGCFLDTMDHVADGAAVTVTVLDPDAGDAVVTAGRVMRTLAPKADGTGRGVGVFFPDPPDAWLALVGRHGREHTLPGVGGARPVRLRVVVVGDRDRRRGALALYVTSGWDIRFASDVDGVREALAGIKVDAVIAEHDLADARWTELLGAARAAQPDTRRIVRTPLHGRAAPPAGDGGDLVHRIVDEDAGLEALLDALTADLGPGGPAPVGPR
jgi:hypothetical protein